MVSHDQKNDCMHQQLSRSLSQAKMSQWDPRQTLQFPFPNPEEKSQKVKCFSNPRKVRKIGEREKSTFINFIKKVVVWAFFVEVQERKANRRMEKSWQR